MHRMQCICTRRALLEGTTRLSLPFLFLPLACVIPDGLKPPKGGKSPRGLVRQPRAGKHPLEGGDVQTRTLLGSC